MRFNVEATLCQNQRFNFNIVNSKTISTQRQFWMRNAKFSTHGSRIQHRNLYNDENAKSRLLPP